MDESICFWMLLIQQFKHELMRLNVENDSRSLAKENDLLSIKKALCEIK